MRRTVAAVAAVAAVLLAGCVPQAPSPTPSPTPTFMCTPEAGGTEAPCSEQEYQKMKAKDALYAEAEQVYRTYQAEFFKAIREGGSDRLTPGLQAVIGSKGVEAAVIAQLKYFKNRHLRVKGPGASVRSATRRPGLVKGSSLVTIDFCVDTRDTEIFRSGKFVRNGILAVDQVYFGRVEDVLKMTSTVGKGEVKEC